MKPQELRVGNLVNYKGKVVKVEQITKHKIGYHTKPNETRMNYAKLCEVEPIPITEELLLKIGFKKENEYIAVKPDKSCLVHFPNHFITGGYFVIAIARLPGMLSKIPVKHLHQLQNAYYLVTGKELEIKV